MYLVIVCYKCGQLLLAKTDQKTRRCPYCEARLDLDKTKKVAHVKTAQEASNVIRTLKKKKIPDKPEKSIESYRVDSSRFL